jgi:serine phosphatase RsbU (regulator of sigma subunit)
MLKMLMDQYRWAYKSDGDETILRPAETLARLNRDLCEERLEKYLTMFYGVLDLKANLLLWCNGAQFPYPILHDGEEARWLSFRSRPVGLFEGSEFRSWRIELPEAFLLLLVSDGILELLPGSPGGSKSGALLAAVSDSHISLEALAAKLRVEGQKELPDDIAFLAVTRGGDHD